MKRTEQHATHSGFQEALPNEIDLIFNHIEIS